MRSGSVAPNSGTPRRKRTPAPKGLPVSSALVEQFGLTRHHPRSQRFFVLPEWPYQEDKAGYSRCAIIHWYEVANTGDGWHIVTTEQSSARHAGTARGHSRPITLSEDQGFWYRAQGLERAAGIWHGKCINRVGDTAILNCTKLSPNERLRGNKTRPLPSKPTDAS